MTKAILQLNDVGFSFGAATSILEGISFSCEQGETLTLMGASGVGKTTLCRLIAGLIRPTTGNVVFRGRPVEGPGVGITVSFQDYPCFPWLSVEDNLLFGVRSLPNERKASAIEYAFWLLDQVGLGDARGLRPQQLSGGMLQRLSVARALSVRPDVLILDEPFSALDPRTKADLKALLHRLQGKLRFTLLLVLHSLDDAHGAGERTIVLGGSPAQICLDIATTDLGLEEFERRVLDTLSDADSPGELLDTQTLLACLQRAEPIPSDVLHRYLSRPLDDWLMRRLRSDHAARVAELMTSGDENEQCLAFSIAGAFPGDARIHHALLSLWTQAECPETRVAVAEVLAIREDIASEVRQDALLLLCEHWSDFLKSSSRDENHSPIEIFQSDVHRAVSESMSRSERSVAVMRLACQADSQDRRESLREVLSRDTLDIDPNVRAFCSSKLSANLH